MMIWSRANGSDSKVQVNMPDQSALLSEITGKMQAEQGYTVATLNLDHVVKLRRDADFATAYAAHSHVTADGNPIVWFSRLAGQDIALVPGSELVIPVARLAAENAVPVALFGSTPDALTKAAASLQAQVPGLNIVATQSPPMGFDPTGAMADAEIASLKAAGARLVLLALGAPKQEIFAVRAHEQMPQAGFLSIGAGLDFVSGDQKRAPLWVRKLALEWLWRMMLSPRRLAGRYAACIAILPSLLLTALRQRRRVTPAS